MHIANELVLTPLASLLPIQGWQEFLEDGSKYLKTANGAFAKRKEIFTTGILYNIVAMSIEKFVMAALMRHGKLPYNHTMIDLVESMEATFPGAIADIREGLLQLDSYQDICDPYAFTIIEPNMAEIPNMLALAEKLQRLVQDDLTVNV